MSRLQEFLKPTVKPSEVGSLHWGTSVRWNKAKEAVRQEIVLLEDTIKECENSLRDLGIKGSVGIVGLSGGYLPRMGKHNIYIKMTKTRRLGVIGHGQLNFDRPNVSSEYNQKIGNQWRFNSSGILIHSVNEEWDKSLIILYTVEVPNGLRLSDVKRALGNYLLLKTSIIDHFNHQIVDY